MRDNTVLQIDVKSGIPGRYNSHSNKLLQYQAEMRIALLAAEMFPSVEKRIVWP